MNPVEHVLVYLIYGAAFLAMSLVIVAVNSRDSKLPLARELWLLALFGLFHGALEWSHLLPGLAGNALILNLIQPCLMLGSYLLLVEFGRRLTLASLAPKGKRRLLEIMLGPLLYLPLLLSIAGFIYHSNQPSLTLAAAARYLLGIPGSVLSGLGFLMQFRSHSPHVLDRAEWSNVSRFAKIGALSFLSYAVVSGLIIPRADHVASVFTQEDFLAMFGFPIELLRTLCAVGISISVRGVLEIFELESYHRIDEARREAEHARDDLDATLRAIPDLLFEVDDKGRYLHVHAVHKNLLSSPPETLLGHTVGEMLPQDGAQICMEALAAAARNGSDYGRIIHVPLADGDHWFELSVARKSSSGTGEPRFIMLSHDITPRRKAQLALHASEARYRLLAENSQDVIWTMDLAGRFTYISPSVKKLRGFTADEAMQQSLEEMLTPESYAIAQAGMADAAAEIQAGKRISESRGEFEQICKDGSTVWAEIATTGMYSPEGQFIGILGVSRDITERRKTQERIAHMAHHDPLTGLPNRALLSDRLDRVLAMAAREKKSFALLFIDLDRFKPVNDIHGHATGDMLLHEVAARIKSCVRASDTAARIGGDEFVVLLPDVSGESDALRVAEKIRHALALPFEIEGKQLTISSSSGLVLYPDHGRNELELFTHADDAMYRAKKAGRDNVQVYRADLT